jgi:hypothetical protein
MPAKTKPKNASEPMHVCGNCGKQTPESKLAQITHGFWERVSPGEIMPSGECPRCGALCRPLVTATTRYEVVIKKLLSTVQATGGLLIYPDTTVAPGR